MANFKCIKCQSSFEEDINGIIYCPYCEELQPLPVILTEDEKEAIYQDALSIYMRAKSADNIRDIVYIFEQLDGYRDSNHQAELCKKRLEELKTDALYAKALQKMDFETVRGYTEAIEILEKIPEWKNASFKLDEAKAKLQTLQEKLEARRQFLLKLSMIISACLIALAIITFLVVEFLVPRIRYSVALNKLEDKEYDRAYEILEDLGDYKDAPNQLKKSKYNRALEYASLGDALNACKFFGQARGYDDADARLLEVCKGLTIEEQISVLDVGSYVVFGVFEQNPELDGVERLEWIIAEKNGDEVLLISKYAIEAVPFAITNTSWNDSIARQWLNNGFINGSFRTAEKLKIREKSITTVYTNDKGEERIEITQDKVFLLSSNEANRYFASDDERMALATPYLKTKEAHINLDNGMAHYWLRTPAPNGDVMYVNGSGTINEGGKTVEKIMAVRPAIWISVK